MPLPMPWPGALVDWEDWNDLSENYAGKAATKIVSADGKGDYTTIQDAIDSLANADRGAVVVRGGVGTYIIDEKIEIDGKKRFELIGVGWPRIQTEVGMTDPHIEIKNIGNYEMCKVKGLYLDGVDKTQGGGVKISASTWVDLEYNLVYNVQNHCLEVLNSGLLRVFKNAFLGAGAGKDVINHDGGADSKYIHNEIAYGEKGIHFHGALPDRNIVLINHIWETVDGIYNTGAKSLIEINVIEKIPGIGIYQYGNSNTISGNQISEEGGVIPAVGIYLGDTWSDDNSINDNIIRGCTVGIRIDAGSQYNSVQINKLYDCATPLILNEPLNTIRNNVGIVTENGGTATILDTTTEIEVPHGCDYTPAAQDIDVHPIETLNNATFFWVDTIGAAAFKIKVDQNPGADVGFKWSVRRI